MSFELAQVDSFSHQLARAPKTVQNAMKRVIPELRSEPDHAKPPRIKRLNGYKGLWRYRVNDSFRLVYRVDSSARTVTLLLLGDRKEVYERLGSNADGSPGIRVIASGVDDLLEVEPSAREVGEAILEVAGAKPLSSEEDADLPVRLTAELLGEWGVREEYHQALEGVRTEGELLAAEIPGSVIERVMNGLWPLGIERTLQEPVRVVPDEQSLLGAMDSERDLVHLLLKLDTEQSAFVSRFKRPNPEGPWLLKGGPGSGKSVVALYCINALIDQESSKLPGQKKALRILLATFTNSLANAAEQLSRSLSRDGEGHEVEVRTVDSLARKFAPLVGRQMVSASAPEVREAARGALRRCKRERQSFPFHESDLAYLLDEIEWVIAGQDLRSAEQYVNEADRQGRRRALGRRQREAVWALYETFSAELERLQVTLWIELQRDALTKAEPTYDYVFIDEAQDLKPVAVRFLAALAKKPENLFLTADSNQSIYGTGMSWARVAEDVNFSGRAQILKRNYRTTKEIWQAVSQLLPDAEDKETLAVEPVYNGPPPVLVTYRDLDAWSDRLNRFFFEALREERLGPDSAAVLVPQNKNAAEVVKRLSPDLRPRAFRSRDVDITYPGLKVLTMHSAKGLEFPVVAIAAANDDFLPGRPYAGQDPEDHLARQHRLLFVAATRAMRQLMILTRAENPSRFLGKATDDRWQIERL